MKMIFAMSIAVASIALAGCPSLGFQGMSAAEIREAAKDKTAGQGCIEFTGTGGQYRQLYMNVDKGVTGTAGGNATLECGSAKATFGDGGKK